MATIIKVIAINPKSQEIEKALMYENHFGAGNHAIRFPGINSPFYSVDNIEWEFCK